MILLIPLLILAFILRTVLLLKNKWVGIDTFAYMAFALEYKKKKHMIEIPEKLKPNYNDFVPQLFTIFLSIFPKKVYRYLQFLPAIMDLITIVLLYNFSLTFFGESVALLSAIIYSIAPIVVHSSFTLSPRSFSNTFLTLSLISLFYYSQSNNLMFLVPFFIFNVFVLLSHRLTTQSLITVVSLESVVFLNPLPFLVLILAFVFNLITLRGTYIKILKTHYEKVSRYAKTGGYRDHKIKPESPIRIFFSFPIIAVILIYIIFFGYLNQTFLQIWFFSLLVLSFVWVFGDGFRHLTNAIFPASVLASIYITKVPILEWIFFIFAILSLLTIFKIIYEYQKSCRVIKEDFIECCNFIRKNAKKSDVLITFPYDYHYPYIALFFTDINVIGGPVDYDEKLVATKGIVDKFKINWIIANDINKFKKSRLFSQKFKSGDFFVLKKN